MLTINFAGSTSAAAAELVLESITYGIDASDQDPSTTARTVTLNTVTDNGGGADTNTDISETATISVTASNDAPTDIVFNDGVTLNDGSTDGYVKKDQFNYGAAASTQLTVEISFASTTIPALEADFLSYAVSSGSTNEVIVAMNVWTGNIVLVIENSPGVNFTEYDGRAALFDGNQHQISVTWDSATGDSSLYVDGTHISTKTHNQGGNITWATGAETSTLLIGQEQDAIGGGFNSDQRFSGDIFEARVYDDVRTAQEIADNTNTFLDDPTADTNLIANWRNVSNGSGGITDETGNGNDFTLVNSVSFNATLSVREDAGSGDHVAFVTDVIDADGGDTHTFGLTDDAGGAFAINATTGEITVADASQLDYETAATMNITVRATDSGVETYDEVVTINIMDVAENTAPGFTGLDGAPAYTEDGSAVVFDADVSIADTELDALNSGNGDYDGASVTLGRNGGVSTDDVFSFSDGNGITLVGGTVLQKAGATIASFNITTTPGQLVITFTNANGQTPTSTDVDNIRRQITYANSSDDPPATAQIDWSFDDGDASVPLQATGSTTV
ncbi:MAG: hypothetical protein GY949_11275, partial [Gammaproteobacteria bacterium]|nr:hypothetical protein [Gammaproteobacteria bacterium]